MRYVKRLFAGTLSAVLILGSIFTVSAENAATASNKNNADSEIIASDNLTYKQYIKNYSSVNYGKKVTITEQNISSLNNAEHKDDINKTDKSGIVISDNGSAVWEFEVEEDSLYNISVEYSAYKTGSGDLELSLRLDGAIPFSEAGVISLNRTFEQPKGDFKKNISGNEVKPDVKELLTWNNEYITDVSGYETEPFSFYFSKGKHTITLSGSRGVSAISTISLLPSENVISYDEYIKSNISKTSSKVDGFVIEAEHFNYKNSIVITPKTDRNSPITTPQSAVASLLNTVGGSNWKTVGDSVTWKINVKESGLYNITLRARQNVTDGKYSCRKLYIDGAVPFKEAKALRFKYDSDWQAVTLGDNGKDFEFYLSKGEHTLKLEAVAGELSSTVGDVQYILNELYRLYRKIVMITGTSPDTNRDYFFEKLIPNEIKELGQYGKELKKATDLIDKEAGKNGSYTSVIKKVIVQLEKMSEDPDTIAGYLEQFKSNLGAIGTWLLTASEQPLEIDKIEFSPVNEKSALKGKAGFIKGFAFSVKSFIASYVTDYSSIGSAENGKGKTVKVWIQTGRDQAETIRELIDSDYSKKYDNSIYLSVVTGGLLQSVLANQAPDVVFDLPAAEPMEYALRGAAYDLTQFEDYKKIEKRFSPAAVKPASFENGVYAIPQTFSFFMFFYRTDIFAEYGFTVPKTWGDLISMIPTLQRNSMELGLPKTINSYVMFLNQRGGSIYKEGGKASNLDSNLAVSTFVDFTDYFSLYDLSVTFDFVNRFRSGEMPCAISDFINYNQLTAFAPEIKGRWKMVPVPGTLDENGVINNTTNGTATYMMLLKNSKVKEEAWEFMKWFTSDDIQSMYGIKMESILGSCAKVATANVSALSKMTWSSDEYTNLFKQYESVDSLPQVPGGYYLARTFDFAFNRVYNGSTLQNMGEDPSSVLGEYVPSLNDELQRKCAEFGR